MSLPRRSLPVRSRRSSALLLVLVVVMVLSLSTLSFASLMFTRHKSARMLGRGMQARALAESGAAYVAQLLQTELARQQEAGGLYDNPGLLRGVLVVDGEAPDERGRFSVVSPRVEPGAVGGVRFGLEDESSRLNLNLLLVAERSEEGAGRQILMALPGMTEDIADAILDWLDEDNEPRQFGAESDYYSGLSPPYAPRNGPLQSVEELLLVRGVTPELLLGSDLNRNGRIDANEPAVLNLADFDNSTGELNRGWAGLITLQSAETNLQPDGAAKIDLNQANLSELHAALSQTLGSEMADFIILYRQNGPHRGGGTVGTLAGGDLDLTKEGPVKLTTVLDLIGPNVRLRRPGGETVVIETPFRDSPGDMAVYLPLLMDHTAVNPQTRIPGRININQAPRAILAGIPGMTDELLGQILSSRNPEPTADQPGRRHETWLLTEGLVELDQMKELMPFVTGGGSVFRAQIVGYFDRQGPAVRIEALFDATQTPVRLLSWRDISHLGKGYGAALAVESQ